MRMPGRSALMAIALAVTAVTGTLRADSTEYISADAMMAFHINNLAETSQKVATASQRLGATMIAPQLADPLAWVKEEMGVKEGINDAGDAAIVVFKPTPGVRDDENVIILIPVSDYDKFVGSFTAVDAADGINHVKMKGGGGDGYISHWGDYAALAPRKEAVAAKPANVLKLAPKAAAQLKDNDIAMYANMAAIKDVVGPEITKGRTEVLEGVAKDAKVTDEYKPAATEAVNKLFDIAEAFFRDADAGTVGISIKPDGLAATGLAEFKADSYLGGFVSKIKASEDSKLLGLPDRGYIFYMGALASPDAGNMLFTDLVDPIVAKLPKNDKFASIDGYVKSMKDMTAKMTAVSYGLQTPSGTVGADPLMQIVGVISGDGPGLKAAAADSMKYQNDLMTILGSVAGEDAPKVEFGTAPEAKTIGDMKFDEFSQTITGEGPMANQQKQMFKFMYGSESMKAYVGTFDKGMVVFSGLSDEDAGKLVETAKSGGTPLAKLKTVEFVSGNLPKSRTVEFYLALDQIAVAGMKAAEQFGMLQKAPEVPSGLPPLGFSVSSEGSVLRGDAFVPFETVEAMISVGIQAAQNAQRGGGGGGL
ncbi:MAG: hypothetical protein QM770_24285 [Tepidisphaeraceae bacterium]